MCVWGRGREKEAVPSRSGKNKGVETVMRMPVVDRIKKIRK